MLFVILMFGLISMQNLHKYYISNTQIEYVKEKKSVQIITRLFTDDFENVLKERYDDNLIIDEDTELVDAYVERYLLEKFKIKIDGKEQKIAFIGKVVDVGIVKCYLEVEGVKSIDAFEITNQTLFDLFSEQQNIVKLNINKKKKSFILTKEKDKAMLNFN